MKTPTGRPLDGCLTTLPPPGPRAPVPGAAQELLRQNSLAGEPGHLSFKELQAVASRPIPPPICEGNYESSIDTCYIEDQLQVWVCVRRHPDTEGKGFNKL